MARNMPVQTLQNFITFTATNTEFSCFVSVHKNRKEVRSSSRCAQHASYGTVQALLFSFLISTLNIKSLVSFMFRSMLYFPRHSPLPNPPTPAVFKTKWEPQPMWTFWWNTELLLLSGIETRSAGTPPVTRSLYTLVVKTCRQVRSVAAARSLCRLEGYLKSSVFFWTPHVCLFSPSATL